MSFFPLIFTLIFHNVVECKKTLYWVSTITGFSQTKGTSGNIDRFAAKFNNPMSTFLYPSDAAPELLLIADSDNGCIRKLNFTSSIVDTFAGACGQTSSSSAGVLTKARFREPRTFAMDASGNLYVSDANSIRKITTDGYVSSLPSIDYFDYPTGMDVGSELTGGSQSFLYVTNPYLDECWIYKFDLNSGGLAGKLSSRVCTSIDGKPGSLNYPSDVKFSKIHGCLFVVERDGHRIKKIAGDGTISTVAGFDIGYEDGVGIEAKFYQPIGLVIDSKGNLFVSDKGNGVIRFINTTTFNVSTFAGVKGLEKETDGLANKSSFNQPHWMSLQESEETGLSIYVGTYGGSSRIKMICQGDCVNGVFDCWTRKCLCNPGYTGRNCSEIKAVSSLSTRSMTSVSSIDNQSALPTETQDMQTLVISVCIAVSGCGFFGLLLFLKHKRDQIIRNNNKSSSAPPLMKIDHQSNKSSFSHSIRSSTSQTSSPIHLKTSDSLGWSMSVSKTLNFDRIESVVSIPGYSRLDLAKEINVNSDEVLGEGGTGIIFKGSFKKSALMAKFGFNELAIKLLKSSSDGESASIVESMKYEVAVMTNIPTSPYIVCFVGYSEEPLAIVMKYYASSLSKLIKTSREPFEPALLTKIAFEIAFGMDHLHSHGILHLDLKPLNVLIDLVQSSGEFRCVICDFGFANFTKASGKTFVAGLAAREDIGISIRYASPEMLQNIRGRKQRFEEEGDKKIDVYAYAITLYELIGQTSAWGETSGSQEIVAKVKIGHRPSLTLNDRVKAGFAGCPAILVDSMRDCWRQVASERPSFNDILDRIKEASDLTQQ